MKELKKVSRWIAVKDIRITPRHSLWCYAEQDDDGKHGYVMAFRFKNRWYAMGQFIARFGPWGFDQKCEEYPAYITGYDGDGDIYNPLLMELEEYGEHCRLYLD